jgi:hypothetical protein
VRSGLNEFKKVLKTFRFLSVWAVGAGGPPFVAALASLAPPPWPKQITLIAGVADLVVIILVFQYFGSATRKRINRALAFGSAILVVAALIYLFVFTRYTFVIPPNNTKEVKGLSYTQNAKLVYGRQIADDENEILSAMEYKADRLWQAWSIAMMTDILNGLWVLLFATLSAVISLFIFFQRRYH